VGLIAVWLISRVLRRILFGLTRRTRSASDDVVVSVVLASLVPVAYLAVVVWAWDALPIEGTGDWVVYSAVRVVVVVLVVRMVNRVLLYVLQRALRRVETPLTSETLVALSPLIRSLVWILGILVLLQNQGVQLGAVFATLAGAGIGIGLALQGPVRSFIDYITILVDKPFTIGETIRYKDFIASVEQVGVRATQLRSIDGQRIVVANDDLLANELENLADLPRRRLLHRIGVVYQTPADTVAAIPGIMKEVTDAVEGAEFGRAHFIAFADSCLEFEFVYFVPSNDYDLALNLQHQVNLGLMRAFEDRGISFAYPTRTLFLSRAET
jgi:small-conductance mechanosensitive channel